MLAVKVVDISVCDKTAGSYRWLTSVSMTDCWWLQVVADYFGAGIDDTHIKMRGAPVLEEPSLSSHQKMIADKLTVSELMTMAVVALPPVVKVLHNLPLLVPVVSALTAAASAACGILTAAAHLCPQLLLLCFW